MARGQETIGRPPNTNSYVVVRRQVRLPLDTAGLFGESSVLQGVTEERLGQRRRFLDIARDGVSSCSVLNSEVSLFHDWFDG